MSEEKKYWRDSLIKLLGWGTTILAAIAIVALNDSQKYELIWPLHQRDRYRAIVLLIFVFAYGIAWFLSARWIYIRHLNDQVDSTVLPWKAVRSYLVVVILCMWALALATTLRTRPPKPDDVKTCVAPDAAVVGGSKQSSEIVYTEAPNPLLNRTHYSRLRLLPRAG